MGPAIAAPPIGQHAVDELRRTAVKLKVCMGLGPENPAFYGRNNSQMVCPNPDSFCMYQRNHGITYCRKWTKDKLLQMEYAEIVD